MVSIVVSVMWPSSSPSSSDAKRPVRITVRDLDAERGESPARRPTPSTNASSSGAPAAPPLSMGWLLRLFRSDFFDTWMAVCYLYRYRSSTGVLDFLCNELYHLSDEDLEAFLPQVCNLLVYHARDSPALERFVMDKCATSLHFAAQVYWFLQAAVEDAVRDSNKDAEARCRLLRTRCETATVNGVQRAIAGTPRDADLVTTSPNSSSSSPSGTGETGPATTARPPPHPTSVQDVSQPEVNVGLMRNEGPKAASTAAAALARMQASESAASLDDVAKAGVAMRRTDPDDPQAPAGSVASDVATAGDGESVGIEKDGSLLDGSVPGDSEGGDVDESGGRPDADDSIADPVADARLRAIEEELAAATIVDDGDVDGGSGGETEVGAGGEKAVDAASAAAAAADSTAFTDAADVGAEGSVEVADAAANSGSSLAVDIPADGDTALENAAMAADTAPAPADKAKGEDGPQSKADDGDSDDAGFDPSSLLTMKQERFDYFNDTLTVAKVFVRLSLVLRDVPIEEREAKLKAGLEEINDILLRRMAGEVTTPIGGDTPAPAADAVANLGEAAALRSVHLPLTRAMSPAMRILRVIANDAIVLNSRQRVPYMLFVEVLPTDMLCCDPLIYCHHIVRDMRAKGFIIPQKAPPKVAVSTEDSLAVSNAEETAAPVTPQRSISSDTSAAPSPRTPASAAKTPRSVGGDKTPAQRQRDGVLKAVHGSSTGSSLSAFSELDTLRPPDSVSSAGTGETEATKKSKEAALLAVYGELWSWKEERILKSSPFRSLKDARLMPFIVKAGDDLRQEQLAIQLISQFEWIFKEEAVNVYLRPFTVMSISSDAGFVEVIPDAVSVHSLKKRTPNFVSLLDYFERAYGKIGSRSFRVAQRKFIRSMAGYSLVSYFLQIKDRHNGNIMIDAEGHIVHIDFGFMLTNSPGAIKFENVPFKLTEEYLQVMCARKNVQDASETSKTEGYRYFQELFVLGLLAARKHYEKLTTLVEIMMEGTSMPCMSGGHSVVESLRHRFSLGVSEEQCIANALALVEESRLSWRSASYDRYQTLTNAIQ